MLTLPAAGIGAGLAIIAQVNESIGRGNYDEKDAPSDWLKFSASVVAGILVAILPFDAIGIAFLPLAPPIVALLAAGAAPAVYRIFSSLVKAALRSG
jgi:hypothetical protein